MKRKKLLSTALAGALVAAQMVMPVMAADGGSVDVDVTTKNVVIRVAVPTSLEIAVNQFEKGDKGSQITSGDFTIQNKSEIPVKMTVTSTVELDATNPIGLVSTKAAAETSTAEDGEAWLAVAAMVEAPGTGTKGTYSKYVADAEEGDTKIGTLDEKSANVTTFAKVDDSTSSYYNQNVAEQVFYLAADTAANPTYADVKISDADSLAAAKKTAYAQFYKVTQMSTQPANDAALQALVDTKDVAVIIPGTDPAPDQVTVLKKGTANVTKETDASAVYYDIDAAPTDISAMTTPPSSAEIYIYGEVAAAASGGDAGFRFIGKLSDKESWTAADIKKVHINYDIKGVTDTKYEEVKDDCIYGFGGGTAAAQNPSISAGATAAASGAGHDYEAIFTKGTALTFTVDFGNQGATSITSAGVGIAADSTTANASIASVSGSNVTIAGNAWSAAASGSIRYCKITLDDGTDIVVKITFA